MAEPPASSEFAPSSRQIPRRARRRLHRRQRQGTLLTTEECLLSKTQQRNRGMSRKDYEKLFADYLGNQKCDLAESGIAGDDTHGHVDDITRFVSPDTVVTAVEPIPATPTTSPCEKTSDAFAPPPIRTASPWPSSNSPCPPRSSSTASRLPASYANFYIANGIVLVPVFNDPNDRVALDILADCFPTARS